MSTRSHPSLPTVPTPSVDSKFRSLPVLASGTTVRVASPASIPSKKKQSSTVKASASAPSPDAGGRPRLLWVGDAAVPTGFATVTHSVLQHLSQHWDVTVSGINYDGSSHEHPYEILPARKGGDMWGMNHFASLCETRQPDAVVINSDPWHVAAFMDRAPDGLPIVAYMPVDGAGLDPHDMSRLNQLAAAVWYTDFGFREAQSAGFTGQGHVIPHGLDATLWQPMERTSARQALGLHLPEDAFIVGNVNRNQPRKRLDLTISAFSRWVREKDVRNAWLLLHCAQNDTGWDLQRVARYYGVSDRLLLTGPRELRQAASSAHLRTVYTALDVQVSTTLGEGWGLTTMEGMACGIPQIVPAWAGLNEWALPALKVPCHTRLVHPDINTVGALPDEAAFIAQLDRLHRDRTLRLSLSEAGMDYVRQPKFRWSSVAEEFHALLGSLTGVPAPSSHPRTVAARA